MSGLLRAVARVGSTDLIDKDGETISPSAWAEHVGEVVPFKNLNGANIGVARVEPDGKVSIHLFTPQHEAGVDCREDMPDIDVGGGVPAKGHRSARRGRLA